MVNTVLELLNMEVSDVTMADNMAAIIRPLAPEEKYIQNGLGIGAKGLIIFTCAEGGGDSSYLG